MRNSIESRTPLTLPADTDRNAHINTIERNYQDPLVTVAEAQKLARRAHRQAEMAHQAIDATPEGQKLRQDFIDPLLTREREIRALTNRISQGGPLRATDTFCLQARLQAKRQDYERLRQEMDWSGVPRSLKFQIADYVEARRREIRLGDAELVRRQAKAALTRSA